MADNQIYTSPQNVKGTPFLNVIFAGSALLSDGYQAGAIGTVGTIFSIIYADQYTGQIPSILSSMMFIGIIIGQLTFGYISDLVGRKNGMISATFIVIVGAALCASSYGYNGSIDGMFVALAIYRVILGIGVGAEYPCGSVAASESAEEASPRRRGLLFVGVTNCMIDLGFVIAAIIPTILLLIFNPSGSSEPSAFHSLEIVWRFSLAIGVIPPLSVLYFRIKKLRDSGRYQNEAMKRTGVPYRLILKRYWKPILGASINWFIYDFIAYPFGLYSSTIIKGLVPGGELIPTFAWNILLNFFYLPGAFGGAYFTDVIGSKNCLIYGYLMQSIVGFILAGIYNQLTKEITAFVIAYGIFLSVGEAGAGNNVGLIASRIGPTAVRGQIYGICAAIGKLGAFVGSYAFKAITRSFQARGLNADTGPFFIASGLVIIAALSVYYLIPDIDNRSLLDEDQAFREYLVQNGFDITFLGTGDNESIMSDETENVREIKTQEPSVNAITHLES